jgi:hypothetical protein
VAFEAPEDIAVKVGVAVAEGVLSADVELFEFTLSCRRRIAAFGGGGGSRRSKMISPLLSSSLNSAGSYAAASSSKPCPVAAESKDIRMVDIENK